MLVHVSAFLIAVARYATLRSLEYLVRTSDAAAFSQVEAVVRARIAIVLESAGVDTVAMSRRVKITHLPGSAF